MNANDAEIAEAELVVVFWGLFGLGLLGTVLLGMGLLGPGRGLLAPGIGLLGPGMGFAVGPERSELQSHWLYWLQLSVLQVHTTAFLLLFNSRHFCGNWIPHFRKKTLLSTI